MIPLPHSLRLRFKAPVLPDDLPLIFQLQSDPLMMRYIRTPEQDIQVVENRVLEWSAYAAKNPGLGVWMLYFIEGGDFAGYCVLREAEWREGNDLEIGYLIATDHWGKGLATEVANALCLYAFEHFEVQVLVAFIDPENTASRRVLEKCGFEPEAVVRAFDADTLRLKLTRQSFQR